MWGMISYNHMYMYICGLYRYAHGKIYAVCFYFRFSLQCLKFTQSKLQPQIPGEMGQANIYAILLLSFTRLIYVKFRSIWLKPICCSYTITLKVLHKLTLPESKDHAGKWCKLSVQQLSNTVRGIFVIGVSCGCLVPAWCFANARIDDNQ